MTDFSLFESNVKKIHFIGIGGSSMSGLAEIVMDLGYKVSGSDIKASDATQRLESLGARIHIYHSEDNIEDADLVVYTVAVKENNPELCRARALGIPIIDRAALLGQLMKRYPFSISIAGTHGKTTTTSMTAMIMLEAALNPTVHIGGELSSIGGNTRIGGGEYFLTEACEYYGSFLKLNPFIAVILNIELDHVDYFRDIDHVRDTFLKFASLVSPEGYTIGCADDANTRWLLDNVHCNKITYGIENQNADWTAKEITFDQRGCASFIVFKDKKRMGSIDLNVPGIHNVSNSLAAICACFTLGCSMEAIREGLFKFTGTHRRFELKGCCNDIKVIDDYAHHPSEVRATLNAARNACNQKVWCVFQPHTYTRTKFLLDDFAAAFPDADAVIVSDIYAAREADTGEIHASALADRIKSSGKNALYLDSFDAIAGYLEENVSSGDVVITMGAGDIYKVGELLLKKLTERIEVFK